jgi:hypothetical protein
LLARHDGGVAVRGGAGRCGVVPAVARGGGAVAVRFIGGSPWPRR